MDIFQKIAAELADVKRLRDALAHNKETCYELDGASDALRAHLVYALGGKGTSLIVCPNDEQARAFHQSYRFFDPSAVFFPAKDLLFFSSDLRSAGLTAERIRALNDIHAGRARTVILAADALLNRLPVPKVFFGAAIKAQTGGTLDPAKTAAALVNMGYESTHQVEAPGQFATRGGIIDVFPLTESLPIRIELWDDEVDSIRRFDVQTQKSIDKIDTAFIIPAMELVLDDASLAGGLSAIEEDFTSQYDALREAMKTEEAYHLKTEFSVVKDALQNGLYDVSIETYLPYFLSETCPVLNYLGPDVRVFISGGNKTLETMSAASLEFSESMNRRLEGGSALPGQLQLLLPADEVIESLRRTPTVLLSGLAAGSEILPPRKTLTVSGTEVSSYNGSFPTLVRDLHKYKTRGFRAVLTCESPTRARRLADDLLSEDLNAFFSEDRTHEIQPGEIMVLPGELPKGFAYPDCLFAAIAENDIFGGRRKRNRRKKRYTGERIADLGSLKVGDYVVHENHGLGIYQGIERIDVSGTAKDYIKIEYARGSNLYILATQLDTLGRYTQTGDRKPKLSKLGGNEWEKTKSRVRAAVAEVAKDLVDLYSARSSLKGFACGEDTVWQKEFEEIFPYEETESQLLAIEDVKQDMESDKIMDRLICGDVGYGKTEIALRAAFKAVQENKQVIYLCPTTILCKQHYDTFRERMKGYPVNVGMLSRFHSAKQNAKTAAMLGTGELDICIGTHRALSKDVHFKDLGLLIIDEEQRFGVAHKEKIKQLKQNVDVMSLSATPIPRTLHMSLVGIRDMSVLEEAPLERMPVQTYVFEEEDEMVREAISRELARGGQVYYVVNRIGQIEDISARVQALVPGAKVSYAHGRMPEGRLLDIMDDFLNRDIDVLVSTTIIEIGLDIPNVNTIIIRDADQFGLSQLYQLRGRVGRSNRRAYAYLMYRRDKLLKETAEKRLSAIREFTDLGSGFKIAMRDLEIRGAGTLLGKSQHGHMEAVGYDLYCKLLGEAVRTEQGETAAAASFETTVDVKLDAFIPREYIPDSGQKLDFYKRIAFVSNETERQEMIDELIDRFGDPGKPVMNLLFVAMLRAAAHAAYITEIKQRDELVKIALYPKADLDPAAFPALIEAWQPYLTFIPDKDAPGFTLDFSLNNKVKPKDIPQTVKMFCEDLHKRAGM